MVETGEKKRDGRNERWPSKKGLQKRERNERWEKHQRNKTDDRNRR